MDPIAFEAEKKSQAPEPNESSNDAFSSPSSTPFTPMHEASASVFSQPPTQLSTPPRVSSGSKFSLLKSYAYLPEYAILLIVLLAVVSAIVTLFGIGIENLAGTSSPSDPYGYTEGISSFLLTSALATLIVTLPLAIILFIRTKRSEAESPLITQHRWRKGFLGTFLIIQTLSIICNLFALAYDLLSRVINPGGVAEMFTGDALPVWAPIVTTLLSVSLMSLVVFVMSADYRKQRG